MYHPTKPWTLAVGAALLTTWAGIHGCPAPPEKPPVGVFLLDSHASEVAPPPCASDDDCMGLAAQVCQRARCGEGSVCVFEPHRDGSPCSLGDGCIVGMTCLSGECLGGSPKPPCGQTECGIDGCGNACGTCFAGTTCQAGQCMDTSCGGVSWAGCCTLSGTVQWCDEGELNQLDCAPSAKECGWEQAKGHYDCGTDEAPAQDPSLPYLCLGESCPPEPCEGRVCGHRCGVPCGDCPDGTTCGDGICHPLPAEPDLGDALSEDTQSIEPEDGPTDGGADDGTPDIGNDTPTEDVIDAASGDVQGVDAGADALADAEGAKP